ncbi:MULTISPECIES: hypothetical protein [Chryseobacterium]|uniref:Cell wall anchor protein n=1 Tax=Chryseobacterium koreense CCUG 49689 TaxID=1304281 RepID=A0A0J7LMI7_9FLAO|nr:MULTISPECIES: hypothetical protein [Chryseobacterium]KMQ70315.1 hypothetical protein ACM44_12920 [Chryseobacterium koreense CCUG 49689]MBB5334483.1 cell shape-determining protein MreC [Chryseobacterium koreense]
MNIEVVLTALVGIITSVVSWFAARRKNLADVQSNELDNVEKAVKFYREQMEDIANRWKTATEEANTMNKLYRQAIQDLHSLEIKFNLLADENRALIEELKKYKQLNGKILTNE